MSETAHIKITDQRTGKVIEGTLEFTEKDGMQLAFMVNEPLPTTFDPRFAVMTALAEGIKAVADGADQFAQTGKMPDTQQFTVIPTPKNDLPN